MRTDDHRSTETLFAVVDAPAAQGVIAMRPRSFRKNAHSSFRFLLIRGIVGSPVITVPFAGSL